VSAQISIGIPRTTRACRIVPQKEPLCAVRYATNESFLSSALQNVDFAERRRIVEMTTGFR
jgi:hypothetical protein